MKRREALATARGQIAWILALVISTAIIIQLERVDFANQVAVLARNPLLVLSPDATDTALAAARAAHLQAPDSPDAQAQLLTALSLRALVADVETLRPEAHALIAAIHDRDTPIMAAAIEIATAVFGAP